MNTDSLKRALRVPGLIALLAVAAFAFAACGGDDGGTTPAPAPPPPPTPAPAPEPEPDDDHEEVPSAHYTVQYTPMISSNPLLQALGAQPFPDGVGTAPSLAFFAHPIGTSIFEEGGIASDGLKVLAETGDASALIAEAEAMGFISLMSTEAELEALLANPEITLTEEAPCVTFAQMIAPSPDWFIGFTSVCAAEEHGDHVDWFDEVTLTSVAFDAGTAEGDDYKLKAEGDDTDPREPVTLLDVPPFSPPGTPVSLIVATRAEEEE